VSETAENTAPRKRRKAGLMTRLRRSMTENRIGELLMSNNMITPEDLHAALVEQAQTKRPLGSILIRNGMITHAMLKQTLRKQLYKKFTMVGLILFMCFLTY
tara:strand:+ start:251 stop:556 length:306 start_codon:yes stop_codon:yes gene_type:complete